MPECVHWSTNPVLCRPEREGGKGVRSNPPLRANRNPPLTAASPPLPCSRVVARAASSEQVAGGRWAAEDFFPVNERAWTPK